MNDTNDSAKGSATSAATSAAASAATSAATSAAAATTAAKISESFTPEERAAMKQRANALKANARRGSGNKTEEEEASEVLTTLTPADEERISALVKKAAG
jgi:hypothetical protein